MNKEENRNMKIFDLGYQYAKDSEGLGPAMYLEKYLESSTTQESKPMPQLNDIISGLKWGEKDAVEAHDQIIELFKPTQEREAKKCECQMPMKSTTNNRCVGCNLPF